MMHRKVIALAVLSLLIAGCSLRSREAPPEDIDKAAAQFFERVKNAEYEKIYDDAADAFKKQNAKAAVLDNLKQLASRGRIESYHRLSLYFDREGENRVALPVYAVVFDQAGKQVAFKFLDDGGEWKLLGFSLIERGSAPQPG